MSKSLIEELAVLKDLFEVDSKEADVVRRAMFRIDEQERAIARLEADRDEPDLLSGRGRLMMAQLERMGLVNAARDA